MSNLKDVAELAGVSVSTVSRVLDNKSYVSSSTRKTVLAAAKKLNYQPNVLAKSLKSGATHMIALMIPDIQNPYLPMIVRGAEDTARANGYTMILCNTDENMQVEKDYIKALRARWIDGVIVSSMQKDSDHVRALREENFPVVLAARYYDDDFDCVGIDNEAAAYQAVRFLYEKGNRRIAIALGNTELNIYRDRYAGYLRAVKELGLPLEEAYVLRETKAGLPSIIEQTKRLCSGEAPCPDAIFATNDTKALAVMRALYDCGKQTPQDVSVMGVDDIAVSALVHPSLTTVHQPLYEIGAAAVKKLLQQIEAARAGKSYVTSVELLKETIIERESTCQR